MPELVAPCLKTALEKYNYRKHLGGSLQQINLRYVSFLQRSDDVLTNWGIKLYKAETLKHNRDIFTKGDWSIFQNFM